VDDIDEAIQKITTNGGTLVVPKTELPNVGWRAFFRDPEGNINGLWQVAKKQEKKGF
jgi:predicted enzyme related to lactoylglutathione lyase